MPVRQRALLNDKLVTILEAGKSLVKIRDEFGNTHTVRKRQLKPLPKDDPRATFTFGDDA